MVRKKQEDAVSDRKESFKDGIAVLLKLREDLFGQITSIVNTSPKEAFSRMPFAGAKGYHSKTLGYSQWHIFRIEDIVAHTLICQDSQIYADESHHAAAQSCENALRLAGCFIPVCKRVLENDSVI